jgi:hypothetical protein
MPAPKSRSRDRFRPPGSDAPIELGSPAETPSKDAPPATLAPPGPLAAPVPRRPLQYRRPGISWVTVLVLGFAAVGVAAVCGTMFKRLTTLAFSRAREVARPAAPVIYNPLAKDDGVLVSVQVSPRHARLMLDGEPLVSNPVRQPRGPKPHKLAATAEGYAPTVEEFTADATKTVQLRLPKARR